MTKPFYVEIPKWVLQNMGLRTQRQFKEDKRRSVIRALKELENNAMVGLAYSPANPNVSAAIIQLRAAVEAQSIKNWGR